MSVSYKKLLHMMIEKDISNQELMRQAKISANIIKKIQNGQYMALDCTPNDILEFILEEENKYG